MARKKKLTAVQSFTTSRVNRGEMSFHPANPQEMDEEQSEALSKALHSVGLVQPIVWNKRTGRIVGGNHRIREIDDREGYDPGDASTEYSIDVSEIDVDEDTEHAILVLLNNRTVQGAPKVDALRSILGLIPADKREMTGFTPDNISHFLGPAKMEVTDRKLSIGQVLWGPRYKESPDESDLVETNPVPEPPKNPVTQPGDLWVCDNHVVMCGDCTDPAQLARLVPNGHAEMMFADPPYGVDYDGGHFHSGDVNIKRPREKLAGDAKTDIYGPFLKAIAKVVDGPCYVWFAGAKGGPVYDAVEAIGGEISTLLVWHKTNATYAAMNAQYKQRHEPCLYFKTKGSSLRWVGPTTARSLWEHPKEGRNQLHPTQKPVWLAVNAIRNHDAQTVLDPFGGSGIVMLAAEHLGRRSFTMELDPAYCDVIVERWQNHTGKAATRCAGGVGHGVAGEIAPPEEASPEIAQEAEIDESAEVIEPEEVEEEHVSG